MTDFAGDTTTELERKAAFVRAFGYLRNRIAAFVSLPLAKIDRIALTKSLKDIGRSEGATKP